MGYRPAIGRWLEPDPIGLAGGDVNTGRFVGDGPTNAIDPSGLAETSSSRSNILSSSDYNRIRAAIRSLKDVYAIQLSIARNTHNWNIMLITRQAWPFDPTVQLNQEDQRYCSEFAGLENEYNRVLEILQLQLKALLAGDFSSPDIPVPVWPLLDRPSPPPASVNLEQLQMLLPGSPGPAQSDGLGFRNAEEMPGTPEDMSKYLTQLLQQAQHFSILKSSPLGNTYLGITPQGMAITNDRAGIVIGIGWPKINTGPSVTLPLKGGPKK